MAVAQAPTAIARYDRNKYNILVPTQHLMQVSPWFAVSVSEVRVDPNPAHGDVYEVGSRWNAEKRTNEKLYALAKPALFRVAAAAGISWYAPLCKLLSISDHYVCYQAAAYIRLPDGTPQLVTATKEIDLRVIEAELRQKYEREAEEGFTSPEVAKRYKGTWQKEQDRDGKEVNRFYLAEDEKRRYVEAQVAAAMIQWRKNKLMRAETGAMLRCIRAALAMRSAYTREELERPFVVPRINFAPDFTDPQVRATILQHGMEPLQALAAAPMAMLGPGQVGAYSVPPRAALQAPADDDEVYDVTPEADSPPAPAQVQPVQHEEEAAQPNPPPPPPPPPSQAPTGRVTREEAPPAPEPPATQGDLFGPPPPPPANPRRKGGETLAYCADCGKAITSQTVLDFSYQKWGKPVCYACGQKRNKNGGGQGG